jgi:Ca2+-binding EF-hand superfamily protein
LKVEENKNIMRTSILTSLVSGFLALSLAACSGASSEPVDQSAQAETAGLSSAAPAASGSVAADQHGRHAPDPAAIVKRFDKNGDGVLQVSELPEHMQKFMGKADTNGDGVLSVDELKAGEDKMRAEHMAKLDTNHDGTVSPEERKAAFEKFAQARFAKMDKNGDGALTKDEVGDKRWERLSVADADKNGSVTLAEIQQAVASGALKFPHRGRHGHHGDGAGAPPAAADPSAPTAPTGI